MASGDSEKEPAKQAWFDFSASLADLDRVFDLLLFLISIVTAVFFQYSSTIVPVRVSAFEPDLTRLQFLQEVDKILRFDLRMYFVPLFLLITAWAVNRLFLNIKLVRKEFLSEFCYSLGFAILLFDVYLIVVSSFPHTEAIGNPAILLLFVFQFLVSFPFVYYYEMLCFKRVGLDASRERLRVVWFPILQQAFLVSFVTWIVLITVFIMNVLPLLT
jgi:hypothetical protein